MVIGSLAAAFGGVRSLDLTASAPIKGTVCAPLFAGTPQLVPGMLECGSLAAPVVAGSGVFRVFLVKIGHQQGRRQVVDFPEAEDQALAAREEKPCAKPIWPSPPLVFPSAV